MKITRGLADHKRTRYPVLTIGNFDGQHRGHQALLRSVVSCAAAKQGTPIAITFEPHPASVLSPGTPLRLLMTTEEKLEAFQEAGIEEVLFLEFNRAFAGLSPEEFVRQVLQDGVGARELFVGGHFAFGKGRSGSIDDLVRLGQTADFVVHSVPAVEVDGEVVSSTQTRRLIQNGEVGKAQKFLGRPYSLSGTVVPGAGRGQGLGWPTANVRLPQDRAIPADGVYATATVWNKRSHRSVAYIGSRPTFGEGERLLEVYLLDEHPNLYDQDIRVQFIERLRGDMVFRTPEELSARIDEDVALAQKVLEARL